MKIDFTTILAAVIVRDGIDTTASTFARKEIIRATTEEPPTYNNTKDLVTEAKEIYDEAVKQTRAEKEIR